MSTSTTTRLRSDRRADLICHGLVTFSILLLVAMVLGLFLKSAPLFRGHPLVSILASSDWEPAAGHFGMAAYLAGTISITGLSMLLAVPVSLLAAIYLTEYAPRHGQMIRPFLDLLSGIPSVVYGVWGVAVVVPAVEELAQRFGTWSTGYCLLSGALVLALMTCPFIIHISCEVLDSVPVGLREASLALGATRWQTVKHVVVRKACRGIVAAVVLGFSRAFGETIAVLMVAGNVAQVPRSLFDPVYPLPALLANNYGEMMSVPLYDAALMLSALLLLVVVMIFTGAARLAANLARIGMD